MRARQSRFLCRSGSGGVRDLILERFHKPLHRIFLFLDRRHKFELRPAAVEGLRVARAVFAASAQPRSTVTPVPVSHMAPPVPAELAVIVQPCSRSAATPNAATAPPLPAAALFSEKEQLEAETAGEPESCSAPPSPESPTFELNTQS